MYMFSDEDGSSASSCEVAALTFMSMVLSAHTHCRIQTTFVFVYISSHECLIRTVVIALAISTSF